MKKILAILALGGIATVGYSQGYVDFQSISSAYAVSTNWAAQSISGRVSASTGTTTPLYYFALIDQAYPGSGTPASATAASISSWSYAGLATNYITAGSINAGTDVGFNSLTAGTEYYVELVGWSASEGTSYSAVESEFASGSLIPGGYFGVSSVGTLTPGGASPSPAGVLFSSTGIPSGFDLNYVVPEPTTLALAGLGGLSLLAFRRKKA